MSNTIRPKVSEAIKQIASADRTGNSKSKIDTQKEFKALQDYLSGNYEELNTTEKNTIRRLLDNAKEYLKNNVGNEEQTNENADSLKPNGDDDTVTQGKYEETGNIDQTNKNTGDIKPNGDDGSITSKYDDSNVDQTAENTGDIKPNGDDDSITSKYDDSNVDQTAENTGDIEPNGDDDSITKNAKDTNAYQQNHKPGKKVTHNGKMCIEMPNGHLYNMQGRRIK